MRILNIKRIVQPSLVQNEKDISYPVTSLERSLAKSLLSAPLAGGGVFGVEGHCIKDINSFTFFAPPYYKTDLQEGLRDNVFFHLFKFKKDITVLQLYTRKSSLFPLHMQYTGSLWEQISQLWSDEIGIMYQVLLAYRQDNWQERMQEQYNDYLGGIQLPSDTSFMRKIQRKMNDSLDNFLKWEMKHAPIPEIEDKLQENGFRYSIRIILYGGTKRRRNKIVEQVRDILHQMEYVNGWTFNTGFLFDDIIQNIRSRKLDNVGKQHVLSVSEVLPLLMSQSVVHIGESTVVGKRKTVKANSPFHLLPLGSKIKQSDGQQIAERFIHALQELGKVKEEMVAKRTQCGPTMMRVTFELPKGLKLSDITKKNMIEDIQTHMGVKHIRISQGEDVGEIDVWIPQEERQKVFLRNYVDTKEFLEFAEGVPLPIFVGLDEVGNPIYKCLNKIRHILVAGTTGSGKSVWVNQLILTLLLIRSPEELQFHMIDVKQVELPIYEKFPHVQSVVTEADKAIKLLKQLVAEMDSRYSLFKEAEVKNIGLYNRKEPNNKLPYIICVIDEYAELALRTAEVHDLVQSMSQLARAAGIHLIIATQDPRVDVIPGVIKNNIPGKIGFRCTGTGYSTFLNTKPPFQLLGHGDGTMCFEGQMEEHIRFQGSLIIDDPHDDDLESSLIRTIADSMEEFEGKGLPEVIEEVSIEMSEMDKLKSIIAQTGETRVSQLRSIMKININRLNELMKDLVNQEWLSRPESKQGGYKLIASDEELEKWRE